MELLTYAAAAKRLACSKSHVRALARAASRDGDAEARNLAPRGLFCGR